MHLKQQGWYQRDIADALGVSEETVSRWLARARDGGPQALRTRSRSGCPPKLTPKPKRLIPEFLWHGAQAYGFRGEVWTCARIARVIEEEFGVRYHKDHVGRLLRELCWTPQVPIQCALQRDEGAIQRWRDEVWPELLRRARRQRWVLVFVDESGFYLLPGVVRTYAGRGPDAGPPREADARSDVGHGRDDAGGQGLHAGAAGGAAAAGAVGAVGGVVPGAAVTLVQGERAAGAGRLRKIN